MFHQKNVWQFRYLHSALFCLSFTLTSFANANEALTYEQALLKLSQQSDAIQAATYNVKSEQERRESLDDLNLPTLSISAGVQAYSLERNLNIESFQQAAGQTVAGADQLIPSSIDLDLNSTNPNAAISSSWLLYTGGTTSAAQRLADASIAVAEAERTGTIEHQEKILATVYFGHLLAANVLAIREDVLKGVEHHLHQAVRFESEGILSKVERLHAQVAYDEARRNLEQARADFGIADVTLRRLLRSEQSIKPLNQLFVITKPLAPLDNFLKSGLTDHSQLAKVRAKRQQAIQSKKIEEARWKPTVVAYGSYNLIQEDAELSNPLPLLEPDWVVGIKVSYPLFDRYDRSRRVSSAKAQVNRVNALERELESNINTYIERSYRSVERSRDQFMLLGSNIELAQETLKLRERLFSEGMGTSLDVVDARLAAARAETERAKAAYGFVVSLVDLLDASGQLRNFTDYVSRADVRLSIKETK